MHRPPTASILSLLILLVLTAAVPAVGQKIPRVFLIDIEPEYRQKTSEQARKATRDAERAIKTRIDPVTSKEAIPPSGDKHDYMSQAPYFWRNPNTPNGLPYVRRDGERNPEIKKYPDHDLLDRMVDTVEKLSLGYFVTGKEEFAVRARDVLRLWFLDPKTRMNPNLEFAQAIPGVNTGRGIGIIETRGLTRVVDSVGLLLGSKAWSISDQKGMEEWFSKYLTWLLESKHGRDEAAAKNNHGTYYDIQVASFALFVGKRELAKSTLERAKQKRIALQIEKDGSQPLELERTRSWDYSVMNLEGMLNLAQLGDHAGVDLWNFRTADGRSIRNAIVFLHPFARDPKSWTYKQISPMSTARFETIVRRAARKYTDAEFKRIAGTVSGS